MILAFPPLLLLLLSSRRKFTSSSGMFPMENFLKPPQTCTLVGGLGRHLLALSGEILILRPFYLKRRWTENRSSVYAIGRAISIENHDPLLAIRYTFYIGAKRARNTWPISVNCSERH